MVRNLRKYHWFCINNYDMSDKFVVKGGLSIPTGKKLELQGTEVDVSATELNYFAAANMPNEAALTGVIDDDSMATASSTKLASSESVKAYVDAQLGATVLTFKTDTDINNSVDLDDDTLILLGGAGMDVTNDGDSITIAAETASATNPGVVELATSAETNTGTDSDRAVTPAGLTAWTGDTAVVTVGTISTGTWQGTAIAGTYIASEAIDSDHYTDGSIDNDHLAANSVDSDNYVDGSIDLIHMSANSVDSDQYVDGSIDLIHMSANSVDSDQYVDGSIDNAHLADDAVGADELAADAVVNASVAAGAAIDLDKLDWTSATGAAIEDFAQDDYVMVYDLSETAIVKMTMDSLEDSVFGNVSGDILIAAGGAATIQANSVALATDTTGDYVAGVTAGTGLTSTGATTGENISHSLSVDAVQAGITTLAGATSLGTSTVMTTFAGTVNVDEAVTLDSTLGVTGLTTLTGGATIPSGQDLTLTDQPSASTDAANKAYVDAQLTASDLDFTSDGGESLSIDLDSEVLDIAGGSNLTTSAANNTITVALDATVSGLTSMSATTVTDGTASLNAGSLSALVNIDGSGDLTMGTITNAEFTVDASGNTDIDGTLNVEGIPTFQAESVHSAGIDCNGTLSMEQNEIQGSADNMLMRAGSTGDDYSFSGTNQLALQADSGIVLVSAVECGGDIVSDTNDTDSLGSSSKRWSTVHSTKVDLQHGRLLSFLGTPGSNASTAVFSFQSTDFKSAKVSMTVSDGTDYTAREFLMVCDENGANPALVEYGVVNTGSSTLGEFDIAINGTAVELKVTNASNMPCTGTVQCQE
jgi:hypothetical protein